MLSMKIEKNCASLLYLLTTYKVIYIIMLVTLTFKR